MLYIQLGHGSIVHYCCVLTVSFLFKEKNLVISCPCVVFIIVIGLTLLVVSPIWIVLWVFFITASLWCGLFLAPDHRQHPAINISRHYLYSAPRLVSHLRAGLFFNLSLEISSHATHCKQDRIQMCPSGPFIIQIYLSFIYATFHEYGTFFKL